MHSRGIDFSTLTLRTALGSAVVLEETAREFYLRLTRGMNEWGELAAAEFFLGMARHEEAHRVELLERHRLAFGDAPLLTHPSLVALELQGVHSDEHAESLTVREALKLALHNETRARNFFLSALDHLADPDVRALFGALYEEEIEHVAFVRAQLEKLSPDLLAEDERG